MRVQPGAGASLAWGAAARPTASQAVRSVDSVQLSGQGPSYAHLPGAGLQAATRAAAGASFGPVELGRQLESQGVKFQYLGRGVDFWNEKWKNARAEKAVKYLQDGSQVQFQLPGFGWTALQRPETLGVVFALHGGGRLETLQNPQLAANLQQLSLQDGNGQPMAAWQAYQKLMQGDPVGSLRTPEDAALAVFLKTGQAPPDLQQPERARALQSLSSFTLSSGDPYASYRALPAEVTVSSWGEVMGSWKTDQAPDLKTLEEQKKRYEALRQELGQDQARPVWRLLAEDGSPAPYDERLALYRASGNEKLYAEALQEKAPLGPLAERLSKVSGLPDPLAAARALERSPEPERFLANLKELGEVALAERVTALPPEAAPVVQRAVPDWTAEGEWCSQLEGWKDNPNGRYKPHQQAALTMRPFSLEGAQRAELTFRAGWNLERERDNVYLQARVGDGSWQTIRTFTDKGEPQAVSVPLSAYCGKSGVQLRFHLSTDGSEEREGFQLTNLTLRADDRTLLTHRNGGSREEVLQELERPGVDRELLAGFLTRFPSTAEGLTAWHALGSSPTAAQADALAKLSSQLGVEVATRIWPDITPTNQDQMVATYRQAGELARSLHDEDVGACYDRLKQLSEPGRKALGQLLEANRDSNWQSSASWGVDPAAEVWSTNPGLPTYANNCDDTLTGPSLDLTGRQGASARFEASWELEDKYDFVLLEASSDGKSWTELRKFEGKGQGPQVLSLSAYEGQKVQLRFRLKTDGSGERPGLKFHDFQVLSAGGDEVFRDQPQRALETARRLDELASRQENGILEQAARLTEVGAYDALRLQPVLEKAGARRAEVETLLREVGLDTGLPQADLVIAGAAPEQVVAACNTARSLAQALASPVDPTLPGKMLQAGFDKTMSADLEALSRSFNVFAPGSRWVRRDDGVMDDSPGQNYRSNEDSALELRPVDLRGLTSPRLCYEANHSLEEKYDHVHVEVHDGKEWKSLGTHEGTVGWQPYTRDLSAFRDREVRLRFRLTSDGSGEREGMTLRKVSVRGLNTAGQEEVRLQDHGIKPGGLEMLMRSVFRPGQDQAALKEALSTLSMLTEGLGDPGQALEVWDLAGSDPDKARDLGLLVHYTGWEQSKMLWFVLKDLPPEQRTHKTELLALGAQLSGQGMEPLALQQRLEKSDLDSEALGQLASLSGTAGNGSWTPTGTWARVQTPHGLGWSDSPAGNYLSNQNTTLTGQALDLTGVKSARLRYQATFDTESGPDKIAVQASQDGGKTWETLASHTGSSPWAPFESDLSAYAGARVQLRFQLTSDGSVEKEGITLADLSVVADSGREIYRDRGGAELLQDALELACDTRSPLDVRKKALTVLAGLPNGLGWRALALLREEEKAGRLKGVSLAQLIQRLPAAIVSDDLEAALQRIVKEGANTGILEEEDAIRVGGVRMKRREATEAAPAAPSTDRSPSSS